MAWFNETQLAALSSEIKALTEAAIARAGAGQQIKFSKGMSEVLIGSIHATARAVLGAAREENAALEARIARLEGLEITQRNQHGT